MDLGLLPGLAKRGQILAGVAVEQELVVYHLIGHVGDRLVFRELVLRQRHREVFGGEHAIQDLISDFLLLMQRHRKAPRVGGCTDSKPFWRSAGRTAIHGECRSSAGLPSEGSCGWAREAKERCVGNRPGSWSGPLSPELRLRPQRSLRFCGRRHPQLRPAVMRHGPGKSRPANAPSGQPGGPGRSNPEVIGGAPPLKVVFEAVRLTKSAEIVDRDAPLGSTVAGVSAQTRTDPREDGRALRIKPSIAAATAKRIVAVLEARIDGGPLPSTVYGMVKPREVVCMAGHRINNTDGPNRLTSRRKECVYVGFQPVSPSQVVFFLKLAIEVRSVSGSRRHALSSGA